MRQREMNKMEALELFKELLPINDYEPYISFEEGDWIISWIKLGEVDSETGGDILVSFWDKDLDEAIQQAYEWYKGNE